MPDEHESDLGGKQVPSRGQAGAGCLDSGKACGGIAQLEPGLSHPPVLGGDVAADPADLVRGDSVEQVWHAPDAA